MKNTLIVGGLCLLAIAIGLYLYISGSKPHQPVAEQSASASNAAPAAKEVPFTVIGGGLNASGHPARKNYAIYDSGEFATFWKESEGSKPVPKVNFKNQYVIGVYAGEKMTGGYAIHVASITDVGDARNVAVTLETPGKGCSTTEAKTSPFEFVSVPMDGGSSLAHTDTSVAKDCK